MSIHRLWPGLALAGVVLLLAAPAALAADDDAARWLPPDTFLLVQITDVGQLVTHAKSHSLYGLTQDPALGPIVAKAKTALGEKIDEGFKKICTESLDMTEPPSTIPWPTGRVLLAIRAAFQSISVPEYDYEHFDWQNAKPGDMPPVKSKREVRRLSPKVLVIADMGDHAGAARQLIQAAVTNRVDKEGDTRTHQTVRGVELEVVNPKAPADEHSAPTSGDIFAYGFKDNTLIASSDLKFIEDVLARMGQGEGDSLADLAGYRQVMRVLKGPGDLSVFFDVRALVHALRANVAGEDAAQSDKITTALGVDSIEGLGMVVQVAPNEALDSQTRALLALKGERSGIPALLTVPSAPVEPPLLATAGLASLWVANYDLGKVFDQVSAIVAALSPVDLSAIVQRTMVSVARSAGGDEPPPNFRQDVLGRAVPPLIATGRFDPAKKDVVQEETLLSVAVRDAESLDSVLGRIHAAASGGDKELRRQMLGANIYVLPGSPGSLVSALGTGMIGSAGNVRSAFAVTGNFFVMGPEAAVDQAVRDTHSEEVTSVKSDPLFRHTASHLPGEASMWFYVDRHQQMERLWNQIRKAAPAAPAKPARVHDGGEPGAMRQELAQVEASIDGDDMESLASPGAMLDPLGTLTQQLRSICDLSTLPEFSTVRKYFGTTCGYVKSTDDGIYLEVTDVKAPK